MSSQEAYHDNNPNFQPDKLARQFMDQAGLFMDRVSADFGIPPDANEYAIGFYVVQPHDRKKYPYLIPHMDIQAHVESMQYGDEISQVSMWTNKIETENSVETSPRLKSSGDLSKPKSFITVTYDDKGLLINGQTPAEVAKKDKIEQTDPQEYTLTRILQLSGLILRADRNRVRNAEEKQPLTRVEAFGRTMLLAPYIPGDDTDVRANPHVTNAQHQKAWLN